MKLKFQMNRPATAFGEFYGKNIVAILAHGGNSLYPNDYQCIRKLFDASISW